VIPSGDGPLSREHVAAQLRTLGVREGGVLVVHSSYRAVRPVENGPGGLIDALLLALGGEGTLVMPSWTGDDSEPFHPAQTPASADLGVVADTFRRRPGVLRSTHPFAFAALGPHALAVTAGPLPLPPHAPGSPIDHVHTLDGQVLLLGVGHDADTTIHLAELMAGVPYGVPHRCTVLQEGAPRTIEYRENDHCCERFSLADDWLRERGLQREGAVGHAHARLVRSRDVVNVVLEKLRDDPLVFLHSRGECEECDAAHASITT
jgi:aminoglycoside N3'-acetyltransferase